MSKEFVNAAKITIKVGKAVVDILISSGSYLLVFKTDKIAVNKLGSVSSTKLHKFKKFTFASIINQNMFDSFLTKYR